MSNLNKNFFERIQCLNNNLTYLAEETAISDQNKTLILNATNYFKPK